MWRAKSLTRPIRSSAAIIYIFCSTLQWLVHHQKSDGSPFPDWQKLISKHSFIQKSICEDDRNNVHLALILRFWRGSLRLKSRFPLLKFFHLDMKAIVVIRIENLLITDGRVKTDGFNISTTRQGWEKKRTSFSFLVYIVLKERVKLRTWSREKSLKDVLKQHMSWVHEKWDELTINQKFSPLFITPSNRTGSTFHGSFGFRAVMILEETRENDL